MSECSEGLSRSSRREQEVLSPSCRDVVGNLPSCLAGSRDNVVGNHLAHRRLSLPVSFDLRFVVLVVTDGYRSELRSSTSRGSSEGPRHLQVTVRSSTTSAGLFVKKTKETFEDSFQR